MDTSTNLNTAVMVRADARAIGMVTAFRTGGTRRAPRTTARELTSECVSYFADNPDVKIPFGPVRARNGNRKRYDVDAKNKHDDAQARRVADARLMANIVTQADVD